MKAPKIHKRVVYAGTVLAGCEWNVNLRVSHRWSGVTCKRCLAVRAGRARRAVQ